MTNGWIDIYPIRKKTDKSGKKKILFLNMPKKMKRALTKRKIYAILIWQGNCVDRRIPDIMDISRGIMGRAKKLSTFFRILF